MSLETDELNQPNDDDAAGRHRRFGFLHADSGVDEDGVDRDVDDDAADDEDDTDVTGNPVVYDSTDDPDVVDADAVAPQPTFTPADSESATTLPGDGQIVEGEVVEEDVITPDGEYETETVVDTTPSTLDDTSTVPDSTVVNDAVPANDAVLPVAAFDGNAPLLGDSVTLKASWQQAAAEFVDDPRAAVAEAAELVEHTTQTLVGALQQRQQQLRGQWDNSTTTGVNGTVDQTGGTADTEELRHMMQSYRALFNQLTAL
jgi:hypothetical protein